MQSHDTPSWNRRSTNTSTTTGIQINAHYHLSRSSNTSTSPPVLKREETLEMSDYNVSPAQSPIAGMSLYHHNGQQQGWPVERRPSLMRSTSKPSIYNNNNEYNNSQQAQQHQQHQQHQHQQQHLPAYTYDRQEQSPTATASPEQSFRVAQLPVDSSSTSSTPYVMDGNSGIIYEVPPMPQGMESYPRQYSNPHMIRKHSAPSLPLISQSMTLSSTPAGTYNIHSHLSMSNLPVSPPPSPPEFNTGLNNNNPAMAPKLRTFVQTRRIKKPRKHKQMELYSIFSSDHKIYKCSFEACESRFSRLEHLKRHENTHYPDRKPFVCHVDKCWRPFSRSDNLKQHLISHTKQGGKNRYVPGLVVE